MHSGKLKIFHVWHTVSSVAQKRKPVDFSNSICKIARLRVIGIFKNFKIGLEVFPNLIYCVPGERPLPFGLLDQYAFGAKYQAADPVY